MGLEDPAAPRAGKNGLGLANPNPNPNPAAPRVGKNGLGLANPNRNPNPAAPRVGKNSIFYLSTMLLFGPLTHDLCCRLYAFGPD